MNDEPKAKRPRKRWKRIVKWTLGTIFVALILWGFVAYWTSTNDCDSNAATPANPMKAAVYCDYGITNLKLQEIEKPTPADDQVLVRVHAASLNPLDGHFVRGMWLARLMGVACVNQRTRGSASIMREQLKQSAKTLRNSSQAMKCLAGATVRLRSIFALAPIARLR
jgi:hypothetical protein